MTHNSPRIKAWHWSADVLRSSDIMPATRLISVIGCATLGLMLTTGQGAASVLATSYNTPCTPATSCSYEGGPVVPTLQQQFTLFSSGLITSVDAALAYSVDGSPYPASDLVMEIVSDSSDTVGNTVYATSTGATGTLPAFPISGMYNDINFTFAGVALIPGTYWLVLKWGAGGSSLYFDWENQVPGTVNPPGAGGTINPLSGFASTYTTDTYMTTINSSVPEPATILTFLGAFAWMWSIRRRNAYC